MKRFRVAIARSYNLFLLTWKALVVTGAFCIGG